MYKSAWKEGRTYFDVQKPFSKIAVRMVGKIQKSFLLKFYTSFSQSFASSCSRDTNNKPLVFERLRQIIRKFPSVIRQKWRPEKEKSRTDYGWEKIKFSFKPEEIAFIRISRQNWQSAKNISTILTIVIPKSSTDLALMSGPVLIKKTYKPVGGSRKPNRYPAYSDELRFGPKRTKKLWMRASFGKFEDGIGSNFRLKGSTVVIVCEQSTKITLQQKVTTCWKNEEKDSFLNNSRIMYQCLGYILTMAFASLRSRWKLNSGEQMILARDNGKVLETLPKPGRKRKLTETWEVQIVSVANCQDRVAKYLFNLNCWHRTLNLCTMLCLMGKYWSPIARTWCWPKSFGYMRAAYYHFTCSQFMAQFWTKRQDWHQKAEKHVAATLT